MKRWRRWVVRPLIAWLALSSTITATTPLGGCEGRGQCDSRASTAELRIRQACAGAAGQVSVTLHALVADPALGLQLAAHDASWVQLCGGDFASVGDAALRGDVPATRAALVGLRDRWLESR